MVRFIRRPAKVRCSSDRCAREDHANVVLCSARRLGSLAKYVMNRRQFLAQAATALLPWQGPVLDIHAHLFYNGRTNEQLLAHSRALGISKAVLLPAEGSMRPTPVAGNEACVALEREHPELFVRFSSADVKTPGAID